MLLYLRGLGVDYRAARARLEAVRTFPFSSAKKRMSTLLRGGGGGGAARVGSQGRLHTKGAPEAILDCCWWYLAADGSAQVLQLALCMFR